MAILNLYADASISGNVAGATNVYGAADGVWTTTTGNTNWTHRWGMQNPTAGSVMVGTHTITVRARKEVAQTGTPTIQVNLYENGSLVKSLVATSNVTSETGADYQGTLTQSDISNNNNVEVEIVTISAGGSPAVRTAVLVDSITWNGDFALNFTQTPTDNEGLTDSHSRVLAYQRSIGSAATYYSTMLSLGPAAYWRFGEPSGTTATDVTGTQNGTYLNAPTLGVTGAVTGDTAVTFNGVDEGVSVTSVAALQPTSITIAAWARRVGTGNGAHTAIIRSSNTATSGYEIAIQESNGEVWWALTPHWAVNLTGYVIPDTNWHFYTLTYDATNGGAFYVDATEVDTIAAAGNLTYGAQLIGIGCAQDVAGWNFNGSIDEPAIFNYALNQSQVTSLYTAAQAAGGGTADSAGLVDTVSTLANYPRALTDNVSLIDPPLELLRTRPMATENLGITDSTVQEFVVDRAFADNENLTDSIQTLNAQESGFWIFEYDGQVG